MPTYCVAANCNSSQTTPGITMRELLRNRPAVRRKWIKFIQFKRADFLAALHHAHLCSEHFSECDFANPMQYRMSKLTQCSGTLSKSCLTGSNWYGCILVGLSGKVSVSSSELELAILHVIWATWRRFRYGIKCLFFPCIYNPQITVSPTSPFSASFNCQKSPLILDLSFNVHRNHKAD